MYINTIIKLGHYNINLTMNDILVNPQFKNMRHDNLEEYILPRYHFLAYSYVRSMQVLF